MRRLASMLWVWFGMLLAGSLSAQQPLMSHLKPDLRVYPQFFTLAQGRDGDLYLGGTDGVLRYDGGRWHFLAMPRPGAVRALATDADGRVWTGAADSFGYITRDATGEERYVDLSAQFASDLAGRRFADIWRVLVVGDEVWFQALHDVFVVSRDGRRRAYWHHDGRLGAMADVGGVVWMQFRGEGLKRFQHGRFEMLPGGERFARDLVYNLLPRGDGRVLVHDVAPSLWQWEADRFVDLTTPALARGLTDSGLATMIDPAQAVFAGSDGRIGVLDVDRRHIEHVRISHAFLPDVIRGQDGGLLVLGMSGLSRLDWPPRWRSHAGGDDAVTGVYALFEVDGSLWAGTWNGVFRAGLDADVFRAEALPLTSQEAWAFHRWGDDLLLADSRRLWRVADGRAIAVSDDDLYPRTLLDDPFDDGLLWIGTEHGPALMQRAGDSFRLLHRDYSLGWRVNSLVAFDGDLWLGSDTRGAFRFDRRKGEVAAFSFAAVGEEAGLSSDPHTPVQFSVQDGALYASNRQGVFRLRNGHFVRDDVSGLADLLDDGELVAFRQSDTGPRWAFSEHSVYRRDAAGPWRLSLQGGDHTGAIYDLLPRANGDAWVGAEAGLLEHRDAGVRADAAGAPVRPRIAAARILRGRKPATPLRLDRTARLQLDGANLEVEFAYPRLDGSGITEFQFSIDPEGRDWSPWRHRASAAFFALAPGDYQLRLRARSRYGAPVEADPFVFTVVPRWYQHVWFWPLVVFVAGGVLALALIQRQRLKVRRLHDLNRQLDALVHARTSELESANVRLRSLADSDGLTGLSNRRHFDNVFEQTLARAAGHGEPVSLLLIDVDHFKRYNDTHGHQAGDDILRALAVAMRESVRPDTLVARYGGEEFAVLVPNCDDAQARDIAVRIRTRLAEKLRDVTMSIGIATRAGTSSEPGDILIARADAALYRAKRNGRDRVESDPEVVA